MPPATTTDEPRVILPYPHRGQQIVREQSRRFNWLCCGRRWRKTTLCMAIAVEHMLQGGEVIWGAPTDDQVRTCYEETKEAFSAGLGLVRMIQTPHMECKHRFSRGVIRFRSLDNPNNARSKSATLAIIDEAAFVDQVAWDQVIRPMLIDTRGGAWLISSPNGRNWYWQGWQDASKSNDPEEVAWQVPSYGVTIDSETRQLIRTPHPLENPGMSLKEMFKLYNKTPERSFRQEYLAEFVEDGGGVFRGLNRVCVLQPADPVEDHLYTVGVDWGRSNDYTAVSVIDITSRPARQVKLDRFSQIGYEVQLGRLRAILDAYQPIAIVAELNSMGGPLVEHLQTDGYPVEGFQTTSASKKLLVEDYALAIERADVLLLDNEIQKLELESITGETLPGGMIRYAAPSGLHDDTMIAGGLAWQRAKGDYFSDEEESEDETREREWNEQLEQRGGKLEKRPGLGDPRRGRGR